MNYAMKTVDVSYSVEWVDSGLHNRPTKLNEHLQKILNRIETDRVLLGMAFCGNSLLGLKIRNYELIMPRADDCISLLCGSPKKRAEISKEYAAYFLTYGWMRGERNLWVEYQYSLEKYGEERATSIAKMMYGHYKTLGLLDSGVKPIEPLMNSTKIIADTLKLEQKIISASTDYLQELLSGPWPKPRYIIKEPNDEITEKDLILEV